MTTIAETRLSADLQGLVDARLDTIDRMLLGRVDRQDRLAIVREVEGQISELLAGRDGGSLDRDDVLAVLARLDPPEAYLPDEAAPARPQSARAPVAPRVLVPAREVQGLRVDLTAGVLGIASMAVIILGSLAAYALNPGAVEFVLFAAVVLAFVAGPLAVILAAKARFRGGWAVAGLVTGLLSWLASIGWIIFVFARG